LQRRALQPRLVQHCLRCLSLCRLLLRSWCHLHPSLMLLLRHTLLLLQLGIRRVVLLLVHQLNQQQQQGLSRWAVRS
jgi:hypothetical protein